MESEEKAFERLVGEWSDKITDAASDLMRIYNMSVSMSRKLALMRSIVATGAREVNAEIRKFEAEQNAQPEPEPEED